MPNVNDTVTFTSLHTLDNVTWRGKVIAPHITASLARQYTDIDTYQKNILTAVPTIAPVAELDFFLIELDLGDNTTKVSAFAYEWATGGLLTVINTKKVVTVELWDAPTGNPEDVLTILRTAGYTGVRLVSAV